MAIVIENTDLWDLCNELESLGGGINTKLEHLSTMNITKAGSESYEDLQYLVHQDGEIKRMEQSELEVFVTRACKFPT
jgi:hypothetical protein